MYVQSFRQAEFLCRSIDEVTGADFIKTSTGYAPTGSKIPDLEIMVQNADGMRVKAAGGVRTLDEALAVIAAGAVRIGTRSTKEILEEAKAREGRGELFLEKTAVSLGGGNY